MSAEPPAVAQAPAGSSLKVLVADDNIDAASTFMALLEIDGHEVDVVHDGHEALKQAQAGSYEVAAALRNMPAARIPSLPR